MNALQELTRAMVGSALGLATALAAAAEFPAPKEGVWIARDFKFSTSDVMPDVRLAYTTVGDPRGEPVGAARHHGVGGQHGMTGQAKFYSQALRELLQTAPWR